MAEEIRVGAIGIGERGRETVKNILCETDGVKVVHVCDAYEDRVRLGRDIVREKQGHEPKCTTDYLELIADPDVDAVVIMSAWENHIPATLAAMRAGKYVGCEVGGAYTLDDCFELVRAYRETGRHAMLLENCCYGRDELMVMNMVRQGLFGKVVACEGGYHHDLRDEILFGEENRHYRLRNYKSRCAENYPTHELGPIAKVLGLNRGNRMLSLTSTASGAWGLNDYAERNEKVNPELRTFPFAQGDMVKTVIKCAGGELITLTLDTTLPRHYSRGFTVRGTRGAFSEWNRAVFLDSAGESGNTDWDNRAENYAKYDHPIWRRYEEEGVRGTHDGMDWLLYESFFDYIRRGDVPPVDTFDMASWMAITPLSEQSIKSGSAPVEVPDFTDGEWQNRTDANSGEFSLDR